jgi:hypothetical protein
MALGPYKKLQHSKTQFTHYPPHLPHSQPFNILHTQKHYEMLLKPPQFFDPKPSKSVPENRYVILLKCRLTPHDEWYKTPHFRPQEFFPEEFSQFCHSEQSQSDSVHASKSWNLSRAASCLQGSTMKHHDFFPSVLSSSEIHRKMRGGGWECRRVIVSFPMIAGDPMILAEYWRPTVGSKNGARDTLTVTYRSGAWGAVKGSIQENVERVERERSRGVDLPPNFPGGGGVE